MSLCGNIYRNMMLDCNFSASSVSEVIYIINFDDLLFIEENEEGEVTNIQLKAGTIMYSFAGKRNSVQPGYYMFPLIYSDAFSHYIDFRVFEYNSDIKKQIEKLKDGKYIVILELYENGKIHREAFGLRCGMVLMELSRIVSDYKNNGSFAISLETPLINAEPFIPQIYVGDITDIGAVCWILSTSVWNDGCIWMDTQYWND